MHIEITAVFNALERQGVYLVTVLHGTVVSSQTYFSTLTQAKKFARSLG